MNANEILTAISNRDYKTSPMLNEYLAQEGAFGIILMDANNYTRTYAISNEAGAELMKKKKKTLQFVQIVKLDTEDFDYYVDKYESTNWDQLYIQETERLRVKAQQDAAAQATVRVPISGNTIGNYSTTATAPQSINISITPNGNISISQAF